MIDRYDAAVSEFLSLTLPDYPTLVPHVGPPRREYGTQDEMQERKVAERKKQTVPLPSIALMRLDWVFSEARANYATHRHLGWSNDLNTIYMAQHPLAYDFLYQLDVWTKQRIEADLVVALTLCKFPRRFAPLKVDLGFPWGAKNVYLQATKVTDNTEAEPGATGDREPRMTIDLILEGWLPLPPREVRTVRKVVAEFDLVHQNGKLDAVAFRKTLSEA